MMLASDRHVENIRTLVSSAEQQRVGREFDSVRALFLGAFYQEPPAQKSWNAEMVWLQEKLRVAEQQKKKDELNPQLSNLELLAVGYLGFTRIYFDAAITAFKEELLDKLELASAYIEYQNIFAALHYLQRAPYTIHGGVVDWMGEYIHDSARYYQAVGQDDHALSILNQGVIDLQAWVGELAGSEEGLVKGSDELAAVLSSLGVIYARRGRLLGELDDLVTGFNYVELSDQMVANPGRKKDLAKMLLAETVKHARKNHPFKTVQALFLGSSRLI